ncbi:MAG: V-type ATP synthase subunit A, partial [Candidatus Margulisiibacteriota bacterium]
AELEEIVRLVGIESLSAKEQLILFSSKLIRENFLYQNAFDPIDQYSDLKTQCEMLSKIIAFHEKAEKAIEQGVSVEEIKQWPR